MAGTIGLIKERTKTMRKPSIGTISEGTLRTEDLLKAFADELEAISPNSKVLIKDARHVAPYAETNEAESPLPSILVNDLQNALNELAPPFCYFGALEGDGAQFGFWPDHEAIQELIEQSVMIMPLTHSGTGVFINGDEGLYIEQNGDDVTISKIAPGETLLAIV